MYPAGGWESHKAQDTSFIQRPTDDTIQSRLFVPIASCNVLPIYGDVDRAAAWHTRMKGKPER